GIGNEVQTLNVTGQNSVTLSVLGKTGTAFTALPAVNEIEKLSFNVHGNAVTNPDGTHGSANSTFRLLFNGSQSSPGTTMTYLEDVSPSPAEVLAALRTIPDFVNSLTGTDNVFVSGSPGGDIFIEFTNSLGAKPIVSPITVLETGLDHPDAASPLPVA